MNAKTVTVLFFAALILGYLVMSVTGCSPVAQGQAQEVSTPITPDGTIYHPYVLDDLGPALSAWDVTTVQGDEQWLINPVVVKDVTLHSYIWHNGAEYQVSRIDVEQKTMVAIILGN
jgi:hypothetical protein